MERTGKDTYAYRHPDQSDLDNHPDHILLTVEHLEKLHREAEVVSNKPTVSLVSNTPPMSREESEEVDKALGEREDDEREEIRADEEGKRNPYGKVHKTRKTTVEAVIERTESDEIGEIVEKQRKLQEELIKIEERKKALLEGISVISEPENVSDYTDMNPIPGSTHEQRENKKKRDIRYGLFSNQEDRNYEVFKFHLGDESGHTEEIMKTSPYYP